MNIFPSMTTIDNNSLIIWLCVFIHSSGDVQQHNTVDCELNIRWYCLTPITLHLPSQPWGFLKSLLCVFVPSMQYTTCDNEKKYRRFYFQFYMLFFVILGHKHANPSFSSRKWVFDRNVQWPNGISSLRLVEHCLSFVTYLCLIVQEFLTPKQTNLISHNSCSFFILVHLVYFSHSLHMAGFQKIG